jgi:hypothetical protein
MSPTKYSAADFTYEDLSALDVLIQDMPDDSELRAGLWFIYAALRSGKDIFIEVAA